MFERLIFERIETRILVGITMFVAITVLVGWIAINEPARMASFEQQYLARSIERGAALYSNTCSSCHGKDGRGIANYAPALNNPQLFGHDFLAAVDKQIGELEAEQATLQGEGAALANELVKPDTSDERKTEINTRLAEIQARLNTGEGNISTQLADLQTQRQALIDSMQAAVDVGYNPERASRLTNVGWAGTVYSFIFTTLVHGRPVSLSYWDGNQMQPFSQAAGGPLRDDQLDDLTNYILNWDKGENWTIEDLLSVQQFAKEPVSPELAGPPVETIGTDVAAIVANLSTVTGDPVRGDALYHGNERTQANRRLNCYSCHEGGAAAPATAGTWTRIETVRLNEAQFAGYTGDQYIAESIVMPGAYLVPNYADAMPKQFSSQLTLQDLADLIAYLKTKTE